MPQGFKSFILDSVRPQFFTNSRTLPKPDFYDESSSWEKAFETLNRIDALLPGLVTIDRAEWRNEIPQAVALRIEERIRREKILLAIFDNELDAVLYLLIGARIPVCVLDGMELGLRYYPERIFRPLRSVNLFIPARYQEQALRALAQAEYRSISTANQTTAEPHVILLNRRANKPTIRIMSRLSKDETEQQTELTFQRAVSNSISSLPANVLALAPEDNLIYLIRQAAVENFFESPVSLNDMHFLIQHAEFKSKADWDRIIWSLAEHRALAAAWFAFKFLKNEWGTQVPKEAFSGFHSRVGIFKRSLLARFIKPSKWFPFEGKTGSWSFRSMLLLQDNFIKTLGRTFMRRLPMKTPPQLLL